MKIASIRLEDNNRTSLAKMLCPRLSERLSKIKLSEFLYSEWGGLAYKFFDVQGKPIHL